MAFMKRKTVKFSVDIQICQLSDVPLVNAVVFAKLRLLEGGSFEDTTERVEVKNHSAFFNTRSEFCCRIPCDSSSGTLEKCLCRVSIRKEQKGGKSFYKLGYVDLNLSEFAASGVEGISRSFLLNGYTTNQRLDNSKVCVKVVMCHQSADPFFRVPRLSNVGLSEEVSLNPEATKALDAIESDGEEMSAHSKGGLAENSDSTSANNNSIIEEAISASHNERKPTVVVTGNTDVSAVQMRRLSQDRPIQRIQNTRFDADDVIEKVISECRLSEESDQIEHAGLSMEKFLERHGRTHFIDKKLSDL